MSQQHQQLQQQQHQGAMRKIGVNQLFQAAVAASMGGQHKPPQLPVSYGKPPPQQLPGQLPATLHVAQANHMQQQHQQQQQQQHQQAHNATQLNQNALNNGTNGGRQLRCMFPQPRPLMAGGVGFHPGQDGSARMSMHQYPGNTRFNQQPSLH